MQSEDGQNLCDKCGWPTKAACKCSKGVDTGHTVQSLLLLLTGKEVEKESKVVVDRASGEFILESKEGSSMRFGRPPTGPVTRTTAEVVAMLNELLAIDPGAILNLIETRVPCLEEMANHPRVHVVEMEGKFVVGLLGILNGLFGTGEPGPIAAVFEADGSISKFVLSEDL